MRKAYLFPSTMCFDIGRINDEITQLVSAGVDGFHMDIMDGHYVDNIALGLNEFKYIRSHTNLPLDVHLMVEEPHKFIDFYADLGADIIYFHPDNDTEPLKTINHIKSRGKAAGIVINPDLKVDEIKGLLSEVDYVLVMTVYPGFAGQKYLEAVDEKWEELVKFKEKHNFLIFGDGAMSKDKITKLYNAGVDGFVLGTSSIFGKRKSYKEIIKEIRESV